MAKRIRKPKNPITSSPEGFGGYETWNSGLGQDYLSSSIPKFPKYRTGLAELQRLQGINAGDRRTTTKAPLTRIWVPTLWKERLQELKYIPFVIRRPAKLARVKDDPPRLRRQMLDGLRQKKVRQFLQSVDIKNSRLRVGLPVDDEAMKPKLELEPTSPDWRPDSGLRARIGKKRIVIFAIIDDGLPFAHRNFRDAKGKRTRVEFCWLQSTKSVERQKSVLFGREYTRAQIDEHIARHGDDEDVLYREAGATAETGGGLASMIERHATHGAHVMDLATGYDPGRDEQPAEEIRIIAVQLPNVVTMDTSGIGKDMYLLSAFHYIFHRADLIAKEYDIEDARLVINFSYGYSGGAHDGEIDIEAAIGELVEMRRNTTGPTALVLPAGNTFLDRMHAEIPEKSVAKGEAEFQWRLQPNDRTPSFLELWFPEKLDPVGYTIEIRDPSGEQRVSLPMKDVRSKRSRFGRAKWVHNGEDDRVGQVSVDRNRRGRWRVLIAMVPSEPEEPGCPAVQAGTWTIRIERNGSGERLKEPIRCWIQRDTDPASLRSGARQSYFDDPDDPRYCFNGSLLEVDSRPAFVRRFGSLNGLATARSSIIVAGFRLGAGLGSSLQQAEPAQYSCAGSQRHGWPKARVTCSSMSDRSKVLAGTVAAGVRSGARSVWQGTSMAAPFVARQLAKAFVSASDRAVKQAGRHNYLPLLHGRPPTPRASSKGRYSLRKDRLGAVLIPPHRQPGIEPLTR